VKEEAFLSQSGFFWHSKKPLLVEKSLLHSATPEALAIFLTLQEAFFRRIWGANCTLVRRRLSHLFSTPLQEAIFGQSGGANCTLLGHRLLQFFSPLQEAIFRCIWGANCTLVGRRLSHFFPATLRSFFPGSGEANCTLLGRRPLHVFCNSKKPLFMRAFLPDNWKASCYRPLQLLPASC